ncbi:hypothetical protein K2X85_16545 [bacterium]|nr:hypothetical protein [bacterium]
MTEDPNDDWGNNEWKAVVHHLLLAGRMTISDDTNFVDLVKRTYPMGFSGVDWTKTSLFYTDYIDYPKAPGREFRRDLDKVKVGLIAFANLVGSFDCRVDVAGDMATSLCLSLSIHDLIQEAIAIFEVPQTVYVVHWASQTIFSCTMGDCIDIARPSNLT